MDNQATEDTQEQWKTAMEEQNTINLKAQWDIMNEDFSKYRDRMIEKNQLQTAEKAGEIVNILKSFDADDVVNLLKVMEEVDEEQSFPEPDPETQDDHV